jgi:hypothetical protein
VKRGMPLSVLLAAPEMDGLNEQVKRNLIAGFRMISCSANQ